MKANGQVLLCITENVDACSYMPLWLFYIYIYRHTSGK